MTAAFRSPTGSCLVAGFLLGAALAGCGPLGVPQPRVIKYDYDPVEAVRIFLTNYRDGRPVMSERELFPKLMEEIRKTDPDKAALVEAGLDSIVKSPATARVEANKLLEKLWLLRARGNKIASCLALGRNTALCGPERNTMRETFVSRPPSLHPSLRRAPPCPVSG